MKKFQGIQGEETGAAKAGEHVGQFHRVTNENSLVPAVNDDLRRLELLSRSA